MPLRPDVRHFYKTAAWKEARLRVLDRAGDRCESCKVPNGARIYRMRNCPGWWWSPFGDAHDESGVSVRNRPLIVEEARRVTIVLTVAHLDRIPGNDDEFNLRALCQSCHFAYDRAVNLVNARGTRTGRKDAARPIQWAAALEVA